MYPKRGIPVVLAKHFQNRLARVIAFMRTLLAAIFLIALLADPTQPLRHPAQGYAIISTYLLISLLLLRTAWTSWWFDFRWARAAHGIDILVFCISVWFTEAPGNTFNSPFIAFFFFLMFAATLRWDWRVTAWSAGIAIAGYLLVGAALSWTGSEFDLQIFARRLSYMSVIAFAFVLFGVQSRMGTREEPPSDLADYDALEAAVRYAAEKLSAEKVAIRWEERDEPAAFVIFSAGATTRKRQARGGKFEGPTVQLFDIRRGRCLTQYLPDNRIVAQDDFGSTFLAQEAGIYEGVALRLETGQGTIFEMVAGGMPDVAVDDMERARDIAREIALMVEERTLSQLERNRAVVRTRESLARDLHDSVAQALAGATFGVEALRQSIPESAETSRALAAELKARLRTEQAHIREMIDRLRVAPSEQTTVNLGVEMEETVDECRNRWDIEITSQGGSNIEVDAGLAYECRQILREVVSNAVRHGDARVVTVEVHMRESHLSIRFANDGAPFETGEGAEPWTIRDRMNRLGGTMIVSDTGDWPEIVLEIPTGRA